MYILEDLVNEFQRARLVAFCCSTPELVSDARELIWSKQKNRWREFEVVSIVGLIRKTVETEHGMHWTEFEELAESYGEEGADLEECIRVEAISNLYDLIEDYFCPGLLVALVKRLCFQEYSSDVLYGHRMPMGLTETVEEFAEYVDPERYREYVEYARIQRLREEATDSGSESNDGDRVTLQDLITDYFDHPCGGSDSCWSEEDDPNMIDGIMRLTRYEFLGAFCDVVMKVWLPEVIKRLEALRTEASKRKRGSDA